MAGKKWLAAGLFLLALAGGCGDGSVVIIIGKQPPAVSTTSPPNGAVNVEPTTAVSAVFNQAMDPTSINAATFTLRTASGSLTGRVSYDSASRTARFTPDRSLPLLATCTATLTRAIRSATGLNLSDDYIWSFTTRDGSPTALLTTAAADNPPPPSPPSTLITLADGSTIEAWLETGENGKQSVFAERYLATTDRWSIPAGPLNSPEDDCRDVVVAGDAEGNALIVWVSEGDIFRVEASRYQAAGDRWLAVETVASESNRVSNLHIDVGEAGRFSLSWQVETEPLPVVRVLRFE